jgi:hypothetical protein
MWRYLAGGVAALAMAGAGVLIIGRPGAPAAALPPAPVSAQAGEQDASALPDNVPEASPRTREEKRFGRYDKDRDGAITRDEYMAPRRKAYAKLDVNRDGVLQFDEWAGKTNAKFAGADKDKSGSMTAAEFATTAVKRKARPARAPCPPTAAAEEG